jgi:hypothetical protein
MTVNDNQRSEKILPLPNVDDAQCLACFFVDLAEQGKEVAPACLSFAHTCGKGDPPDEQELERINEAARELLRREQVRVMEAQLAADNPSAKTESKKDACTCRRADGESYDPFKSQVGGKHYLGFKIQPAYFCIANGLTAAEAHVVKYVCRWRSKGGISDLKKARHWLEMLIEYNKNGL